MSDWIPNPKQKIALLQTADEVLYGGARGGGKTDAGFGFLCYDNEHPLYRALVLRRNADDLRDWISRAIAFLRRIGARKVGNPAEFRYPNGGIVRTGHLNGPDAFTKYQGHEYHRMLFEELTHISSEELYLKVLASCRSTVPELKPQVFATTNPDGPGYRWVKKRWSIPDEPDPNKIYLSVCEKTGHRLAFVPALVEDNPQLFNNDPGYVKFLEGLPDGLREQWREGSWAEVDVKGAYYTKEIAQAKREGRLKFVPFDPKLKVYTVWDLGLDDSMAIIFVQRDPILNTVRIINYYENSNEGLGHYVSYLKNKAMEYGYNYHKHFGPHDLNKRELSTNMTLIQTAEETHGLKFEIIPRNKVENGIETARILFPKVYFSGPLCELLLEALRNYRQKWDDNKQIYSPLHDWTSHGADAFRYLSQCYEQMDNGKGDTAWVEPTPPPVSEYEGSMEADAKHPMLQGVDLGKMG
jgi:hypothetical protein